MSDVERTRIELAIERAMRGDRISRRRFFGRAARGGVALGTLMSLPGLLAACQPPASGPLQWLNWPAYIDLSDDESSYPSIDAFTAATGVEVEYNEGLLDNADFLAQYAPDLRAGNATGWDVMTPGGWVVERMARNGWLEELDHSKLPNWTANCADYAKGLWFDSDNKYSLWWQGGITGIGYDPELTGREITSFEDLLDPAFAGRVGGFSDMRDMFGLTLLSLGVHPADATVADVQRAQEKLLAVGSGHFRGFYDNSYYDELAAGNLALCVAWSGDVAQMALYDNQNVRFVIPAEGGMRWNDNLVIPKGAAQVDNAHKLLDYYYSLDAAVMLEEYIGYFTPVKGVSERIAADAQSYREGDDECWVEAEDGSCLKTASEVLDGTAASVVPNADQIANTFPDKQMDEDEEAEWNALFEEVIGA